MFRSTRAGHPGAAHSIVSACAMASALRPVSVLPVPTRSMEYRQRPRAFRSLGLRRARRTVKSRGLSICRGCGAFFSPQRHNLRRQLTSFGWRRLTIWFLSYVTRSSLTGWSLGLQGGHTSRATWCSAMREELTFRGQSKCTPNDGSRPSGAESDRGFSPPSGK